MTETGSISQSGKHSPPSDVGAHTFDCIVSDPIEQTCLWGQLTLSILFGSTQHSLTSISDRRLVLHVPSSSRAGKLIIMTIILSVVYSTLSAWLQTSFKV